MTNERLLAECADMIGVGNLEAEPFLSYIELLKEWGKSVNLTSARDDREIVIKHVVDSLAAAEFVPSRSRVLDVGTGAGFPGIPLLLRDRSVRLTLVESVGKKVAFLNNVVRSLGLSGVCVRHARAEDVAPEMEKSFDRVVFRAVGSVEKIVSLGVPYLDIEGTLIIMKGPRGKREWEDYSARHPGVMKLISVKELELPFSSGRRVILVAGPAGPRKEAGS